MIYLKPDHQLFVIVISLLIYSPSLIRWRRAALFSKVSLTLHFSLKLASVQLATCARGWLGSRMQSEILASSKSEQLLPPPRLSPSPCKTRRYHQYQGDGCIAWMLAGEEHISIQTNLGLLQLLGTESRIRLFRRVLVESRASLLSAKIPAFSHLLLYVGL